MCLWTLYKVWKNKQSLSLKHYWFLINQCYPLEAKFYYIKTFCPIKINNLLKTITGCTKEIYNKIIMKKALHDNTYLSQILVCQVVYIFNLLLTMLEKNILCQW